MTYDTEIAIVRRFREYPDRIVGKPTHGRAEKSPRNLTPYPAASRNWQIALYWIQEIHRRPFWVIAFVPDLNVASLRPIAIVPATPSTLDGLCGPGQRNGVGSSFELGKDARPPSTVYVWFVVPIYRRNSRADLRPVVREIFVRVRQKAKASPFCAPHAGWF